MGLDGVSLITPTGDRPQCLARCAFYVHRFEKPDLPVQWIIVDDGETPSRIMPEVVPDLELCYIRRERGNAPKSEHTLHYNLLEALRHIKYSCVLFVEDDDWYGPEYLSNMLWFLRNSDIVGEIPARYYSVPTSVYLLKGNFEHASLCQTGIRASLLPLLERLCRQPIKYIDMALWRGIGDGVSKRVSLTRHCLGIKGMPGRTGISGAHSPIPTAHWHDDRYGNVLAEWIGLADARFYAQFANSARAAEVRDKIALLPRFDEDLWKDQVRYKCPTCEFNSYNPERVGDHVLQSPCRDLARKGVS